MADRVEELLDAWDRELPSALTPTSELSKRILALAHELTSAVTDAVRQFELTMAEYDILATLRRADPPHQLTPSQLAARAFLSTGGVTKALHALTARQLVERHPHEYDGRRHLVRLTIDGARLAERAVTASAAAQHTILARSPARDAKAAATALRHLMHALGPS